MEEKIVNALRELGFAPKHPENGQSYVFYYEGARYFYIPNDNKALLNIAIPFTVDHEDFPGVDFAEITQKVNAELSFVKAYVQYDNVWVTYEESLFGDEDEERLRKIVTRMILCLDRAKDYARGLASSMQNGKEEQS